MRIAVMQPYLFPYIGYFQLIQAVDKFVFYDDVNFIKKGWINRNRILINNKDLSFSVPLNKVSQNKTINETFLNLDTFEEWKEKFIKTIGQNYKKAPYFDGVSEVINNILNTKCNTISDLAIESVNTIS